MKKSTLIFSFLFLFASLGLVKNGFSQGIMAPGGTGAYGNMVYGGLGLTTPQSYSKNTSIRTTDMVAAFGVGLGDPVKGLGFQIGSAMLDVSEQDLYNAGVKIHRYLGNGVSAAVGVENILRFGAGKKDTDSDFPTPYLAVTKNLRYTQKPGTFLYKLSYSVGVGLGRFKSVSGLDSIFHEQKSGTYVFGAVSYKLHKRVNYHLEWSGTNLNTGISINTFIEKIPFSIILMAADLTPYSGGQLEMVNGQQQLKKGFFSGTRFVGAFGLAYQFKDPNQDKAKEQQVSAMYSDNQVYSKIDQVKTDLDRQISELEKEIARLKSGEEYSGGSQTEPDLNSKAGGGSYLNGKVKNYKDDEIVSVSDAGQGSTVDAGYYVVIHSFRKKDFADNAIKLEAEKGVQAKAVYNKSREWYYIYTHYYKNLKDALLKSTEQREKGYEGAWVHIY